MLYATFLVWFTWRAEMALKKIVTPKGDEGLLLFAIPTLQCPK